MLSCYNKLNNFFRAHHTQILFAGIQMKKYDCKNWSMNDIAHAMKGTDEQGRRIVIPIFQRGKKWDNERRENFIDSLLKGYPVGTLLFAELDSKTYSVIDGLQRSSTICEYILNPTRRDNLKDIDKDILTACRLALFPDNLNISVNKKINTTILDFISTHDSFDSIEVSDIAENLYDSFQNNLEFKSALNQLKTILKPWFQKYKSDFDAIKQTEIPVIIYSGKNEYLNDIFSRINVAGLPLNDYEIYAATWDSTKYPIKNSEIVENVIKKYSRLTLNDYTVDNFDGDEMRKNKNLTAFEFLFGFGKYLVKQFPFLNLGEAKQDDEVTAVGFELVDACLNDSKCISDLANIIKKREINLNYLSRRIEEASTFVNDAISPICTFKGNKRKVSYLHPKYFIFAMIAFTFREMYDVNDMRNKRETWEATKKIISKRLLEHYIFEIVSNKWHDGGISKMYLAVKERSFMIEYEKANWNSLLSNYFDNELINRQTTRFSSPTNADKLLLNCIYSDIFTVKDNCINNHFDIEHLATKERMKSLIAKTKSKGLPVSHIANLCYLPEKINRKKKDKTIYEETNLTIPIKDIEKKYSFTKADDFEFLYLPYTDRDAKDLEDEFKKFLKNRFEEQKSKIFSFLEIDNN